MKVNLKGGWPVMNNIEDICCDSMKRLIEEDGLDLCPDIDHNVDPEHEIQGLFLRDCYEDSVLLRYCPYCGKKIIYKEE